MDYEAVYAPVIDRIRTTIENGFDPEKEYANIPTGIIEQLMYADKNEMLTSFGYEIIDVNEDGIPELLIGRNDDYSEYGEEDQ